MDDALGHRSTDVGSLLHAEPLFHPAVSLEKPANVRGA